MSMPGRTTPAPGGIDDKYRYSHNGQEKDNDIFVGALSAEYWEYDSRTGRRWENDPLTYSWQSPYATFNNNPIYFADPSGLEGEGGDDKNKGGGDDTKPRPGQGQKRTAEGGEAKNGYETASGKKDSGNDGKNQWSSVDDGKTTYVKSTPNDGSTPTVYYGTPSVSNNGGTTNNNPSSGNPENGSNNPASSGEQTGNKKKNEDAKQKTDDKNKSTPQVHTDPTGGSLQNRINITPSRRILPQNGAIPPRRPQVIQRPVIPVAPPPPRKIPPAAPNPNSLCFNCFIGTYDSHWKKGIKDIADWLITNPDYKLQIFADGGGRLGGSNTWNSKPFLANQTFIMRLGERYSELVKGVLKEGAGKIKPNRLQLQPGSPDGFRLKYNVIK